MSYTIKHGVIEMAIQSSNILQHVMPLGNFNFIPGTVLHSCVTPQTNPFKEKKNLNAPRPSEHPPVWGEKAIVKEGALVTPNGSHRAGPEKYRSTVCQSGHSKRVQRGNMG